MISPCPGSTKLLSLLSEIIETSKSGRNFVLEKFKTSVLQLVILFLWQKQVSVTGTSLSFRNKFLSKNKFLSLKQVSLTQASFCLKWSVCLKKLFLSKKEVSVTETIFYYKTKLLTFVEITRFRSFCREFRK